MIALLFELIKILVVDLGKGCVDEAFEAWERARRHAKKWGKKRHGSKRRR